jgi:hypothetical protein
MEQFQLRHIASHVVAYVMHSNIRLSSYCMTTLQSFQQKLKLSNNVQEVTLTGVMYRRQDTPPVPALTLFQD